MTECRLDGHDENPHLEDCEACRNAYFTDMARYKAEWRMHKSMIHCPECIRVVRGGMAGGMCEHCDPTLHQPCEVHRG